MSEDIVSEPNGSVESKKREAKGTCLKIEGQDGYVFKSYSINPHETADAKSPACSSITLDKDSPPSFDFSSQDDKQLESDQASETDPASPTLSNRCLNTDTEGNMESEKYENGNDESQHIKEETGDANGMEEETQDDERLGFGSSIGTFVTLDVDEYSNLLSGYTSTLYDVDMDAVSQSLLSSMRSNPNPRKKSPAWKLFA